MLPWLALLLPFLVGLGLCEVFLIHAAISYFAGCRKEQPEAWRGRFLTTAFAMGLAWGAQMALFSGLLAMALRMRAMVADGTFGQSGSFTALYDHQLADLLPIATILYTVPIITIIYWVMLNIVNQFEKKKKSTREMVAEMKRVNDIICIEERQSLLSDSEM